MKQQNLLSKSSSLVTLTGTIVSDIGYSHRDGTHRFTVETEDGRFYVKSTASQVEGLKSGSTIQIIGKAASFWARQCGGHHVYVEPFVIFQQIENSGFTVLLTL
ncbi:MAG: hypothetical protein AAF485_12535 [Chloroflexota bacterium]